VGAECIEDEEGKGRTTRVDEAILNWRQVQHEQLVNSIQPVQLANTGECSACTVGRDYSLSSWWRAQPVQ
jgi:hypothetical protein